MTPREGSGTCVATGAPGSSSLTSLNSRLMNLGGREEGDAHR